MNHISPYWSSSLLSEFPKRNSFVKSDNFRVCQIGTRRINFLSRSFTVDMRLIVIWKQMASQFREQPVTWEQENFRNWIAKRSSNVLFLHFILLCGNIFHMKPNKSGQISGHCGWTCAFKTSCSEMPSYRPFPCFTITTIDFFADFACNQASRAFFFIFLEFHFFSSLLVFTLVLALFLWWMERTPSSCEEWIVSVWTFSDKFANSIEI